MLGRRSFLAAVGVGVTAVAGCAADPGRGVRPAARPAPVAVLPHQPLQARARVSTTSRTDHLAPPVSRQQVVSEYGRDVPHEWGLHTSGTIDRGSARAAAAGLVALTFDACGGPGGSGYDAPLVAALRRHGVPATLMLNARWVRSNWSLAEELGADPLFELQSHGWRHLPLSVTGRSAYGITGTRDAGQVFDELTAATALVERVSHRPVLFFRPGTAYCDDVAAAVARAVGTPVVGFTVNGDAGATFTATQVAQAVGTARAGDIVISHLNHPGSGTAAGYAHALPRLLDRGVGFAHLSRVVDHGSSSTPPTGGPALSRASG